MLKTKIELGKSYRNGLGTVWSEPVDRGDGLWALRSSGGSRMMFSQDGGAYGHKQPSPLNLFAEVEPPAAAALKIEKGKSYVTSNGLKANNARRLGKHRYPWILTVEGKDRSYTHDGYVRANDDACLNLVAEWIDEPVADADGWTPWAGGDCPVAPGTLVEVRWRDGDVSRDAASGLGWEHCYGDRDIIAYRVVTPAAASAKPEEVAVGDRVRVRTCARGTAEGYRGEEVEIVAVEGDTLFFRYTKDDPDYSAPLLFSECDLVSRPTPEPAKPEPAKRIGTVTNLRRHALTQAEIREILREHVGAPSDATILMNGPDGNAPLRCGVTITWALPAEGDQPR